MSRPNTRLLLEIATAGNGSLILKDTEKEIEADVDSEVMEPNFYIRFTCNGDITVNQFNMRYPELYPSNEAYSFRFSMKVFSAINSLIENKYEEFVGKWHSLYPEDELDLNRIPNYRAMYLLRC